MGSIYGKKVAVIHAGLLANYQQAAALASILLECPTADVVNVQGVSTGNITSAIAALVANTYDQIFVLSAVSSGGATSVLSYDQLVALRLKLKTANQGDIIYTGAVGTSGSNTTSVAYFGTGASDVNSYYSGLFMKVTAGTHSGVVKKCNGYVGSTRLQTIGGAAVSGAFDNTDTFVILNVPCMQVVQDTYLSTSTAYLYDTVITTSNIIARTWNYMHDITVHPLPEFLAAMADYNHSITSGTSTAGGNTTLTDSGKSWTTNAMAGQFAFIVSGTGAGQWCRIKSNTSTAITGEYFNGKYIGEISGDAAWTTNPSTDSVYYVVPCVQGILENALCQLYLKTYLLDATNQVNLLSYAKLIDADGKLHLHSYGSPAQDMYFLGQVLTIGKHIYDALNGSVTLT